MRRKTLRGMHSRGESCKLGCIVRPSDYGLLKCLHKLSSGLRPDLAESVTASKLVTGTGNQIAHSSCHHAMGLSSL